MELSVLGPFEARRDGEVVALRRGRPRAVLVALLLRAGHVVSSDVLIDQVWGKDQPIDALNALQVQVSYLRRVLGLAPTGPAPALRTVAGGYVLDVDPAVVDADRFEAAVREARSLVGGGEPEVAAALDAVRAALGLWRGEPLADLAYEPFVSAEVDRLHELRAAAREIEVDALLALGQHDEATATLVRYVDEHPLRERLRGQLMIALVRAGRQAEALRAYDAARSMLVEELGVEPGPELVRLQRAVLDQDTSLDWAPRPRGPLPATGGTVPPARNRDGAGAPDGATVDGGEPAGVLRSRLPALTTGLVGREREVAAVRSAVHAHRMVTVTGPGGVGKTRVALAVAHAEAAEPAWLVELASVADGDLVPFEIARAVGVATLGDPLDAVAVRIGDQTGLLVLDTCEHLIGAAGDAAAALLRACPGLRVLATSRRPVGVAGEVAWPLGPLAVPAPGTSHEDVRRNPAVRLFRERSREVRPGFDVTADNAEVVARICRRVDGLPLAIELAAARARVLSPGSILERIDDRFTLLRRTDGVGDPRQQSLRATIDWSHELLARDERVFFRRLGVFGGPFGFDAAAEVAAHGLTTDPLDLVTAMVEHSLITTCGDDTFRMLDTLRADAADRLAVDPGAEAEVYRRLTARLERQADALDARLRGPDQQEVLADLRAEVPNIRAALSWCFTTGRGVEAARLVGTLSWYWTLEAANAEARSSLAAALAVDGLDPALRAWLLGGLGIHTLIGGDVGVGGRLLREAVEAFDLAGEPERGVLPRLYLGLTQRLVGAPDVAARTQDRAIELARRAGDDWSVAWGLSWRAGTATDAGDDDLAADMLAEATRVAREVGDPRALAWIISVAAAEAAGRGDARRAGELADEAIARHEVLGCTEGLAAALVASGRALVGAGRHADAIARLRRAHRLGRELGQPYSVGDALEAMAEAFAALDDWEAAAEAFGAGAAIRSRMGLPASDDTRRGRELAALSAAARGALGEAAHARAEARGRSGRGDLAPGDVRPAGVPAV